MTGVFERTVIHTIVGAFKREFGRVGIGAHCKKTADCQEKEYKKKAVLDLHDD